MPEISATSRTEFGRKTKALRNKGFLPAVLYGVGVPAMSLTVSAREFQKVLTAAGETSLVTVSVEGKPYNVLIHDVAKDPMTLAPIHADFYAVRMDKPIEAKVPLAFSGESPAVKNDGGILVKVLHELAVKALPKDLPHEIIIDINRLEKFEDKIHIKDITLPAGVTAEGDADEVIALVEPPRSDAELEELTKAEAGGEAVAEVKTEREVKSEAKAAEEPAEETAP